jgi:NAD+ synthase
MTTQHTHVYDIDPAQETERIIASLSEGVRGTLRKQGAVVGISGGLDSSVVLALCARAFGSGRVLGVLLPEGESSPESADLAHLLADQFDVETVTEDLSAALAGAGCYARRDAAIRSVFPQFGPGWKSKISLPGNLLEQETLSVFSLTVMGPDGECLSQRLPMEAYLHIVAASNFKQRLRMTMLYYHAERLNYAVVGTPNKNEHELGFFVKYGDGGVDISPIRHLFKSQVYQLGAHLGVPQAILSRTPTTDTYSAGSTQEEFFYRVPFEILDTVWHEHERGVPAEDIARTLKLSAEQVQRVIADIARKQRTTAYLRQPVL